MLVAPNAFCTAVSAKPNLNLLLFRAADWLPWGQRITQLSRVQCDLQGKTGFGGLPMLVDHQSVEIEVPRMRWLMLNQNPASMSKFNSYLAEALTLYSFRPLICELFSI